MDNCHSIRRGDTTLSETVFIRQHALKHGYMKGLDNFSNYLNTDDN